MIAFAVLSGPLPKLGVLVLGGLAGLTLLARDRRGRALATLGALILSPVLLLSAIWSSPQLGFVHRHPGYALAGAVLALLLLGIAATRIAARPQVIGPLALLALPFRLPIQTGGKPHNLLIPLYLVVAAGSLAWLVPVLLDASRFPRRPRRVAQADGWSSLVERLLALFILLYAAQAVYSADFETALQNMVFFYVPFALLYRLLRSLDWTPALLARCLTLLVGLAVIFSVIGFVEYATKTIILNPKLVVANDLHAYFTVNSVFFDPDIFGRFLALVMILLAVRLLYAPRPREQAGAIIGLAVLWAGLVLTLSRSSLGALLVGLGVLAALRWKPTRALMAAAAVIVLGVGAAALSPSTFGLNQGLNGASSGRGGLVSGGVSLFADRPGWGYGSGSFVAEYRRHHQATTTLSASHTTPITVAAEQGLIGETAYLALVLVALICLIRRARGGPVRAALAAAFAALVFHTTLYADFLEDPTTWALLGVGVALSGAARPGAGSPTAAAPARSRPAAS